MPTVVHNGVCLPLDGQQSSVETATDHDQHERNCHDTGEGKDDHFIDTARVEGGREGGGEETKRGREGERGGGEKERGRERGDTEREGGGEIRKVGWGLVDSQGILTEAVHYRQIVLQQTNKQTHDDYNNRLMYWALVPLTSLMVVQFSTLSTACWASSNPATTASRSAWRATGRGKGRTGMLPQTPLCLWLSTVVRGAASTEAMMCTCRSVRLALVMYC